MADRLVWERDGRDWPHREASRFVSAAGLRWHVQQVGATAAPALLLIHGTGGSVHSWRGLMPLLAQHFHVVAADLPGHGFTDAAPAATMSLPGMAGALRQLLVVLGVEPALLLGHSAGAAIATRMVLDGQPAARGLLGLNAAMLPLHGLPGLFFAPMARLLAGNTLVPRLFSWRAQDQASVVRLIARTGSHIDAEGVDLYGRLVRSPGHVGGALDMMANWQLDDFWRDLPQLRTPLMLLVGAKDRTLPPDQAWRVAARAPDVRVVTLPGLGHLAHEEQPQQVLPFVLQWARETKVMDTKVRDTKELSGADPAS